MQRSTIQELRSPPARMRIKAGRGSDGLACVSLGHDTFGDILLTSDHARAFASGTLRVVGGEQKACLIVENCFSDKGVLVCLQPHYREYVLSIGRRGSLSLSRSTTSDLSRWMLAAADTADDIVNV